LSEAVPDALLLADLRVTRTNALWSVHVAGMAQPTTNESPALEFRQACATLTNELGTGPFHMTVKTNAVREDGGTAARFVIAGTVR
jgi:hypothetical protein